jgi:hypothetical protein
VVGSVEKFFLVFFNIPTEHLIVLVLDIVEGGFVRELVDQMWEFGLSTSRAAFPFHGVAAMLG